MNAFCLDIAERYKEGFRTETDPVDWRLRYPDVRFWNATGLAVLETGVCLETEENRTSRREYENIFYFYFLIFYR